MEFLLFPFEFYTIIFCNMKLLSLLLLYSTMTISLVRAGSRWVYDGYDSAEKVLDTVVDNAKTNIIESKFDNVINKWTFGQDKKISGTLDSIRDNISFYLNRVLFLGLTWATILIVYNGFLMVFTPITGDQLDTVKKRIINILIWVVVMTWFYFIIKVSLSIMNMILE